LTLGDDFKYFFLQTKGKKKKKKMISEHSIFPIPLSGGGEDQIPH